MLPLPSTRVYALALATALLTSAAPLGAQEPTEPRRPFPAHVPDPRSARPQPDERDLVQLGPLLDMPVSRTEYRLGPGDRLVVAIFGEINEVFPLQVQPEGSVVVPGIGIVDVLGLSLEAAEQRVDAAVRRFYRNVRTGLSLSAVRTFKVFVVGDVAEPGVRTATAATRVSEVVDDALARREQRTLRRNIIVRRAGGDSLVVDLARFLLMGDLGANPLLREGDVVRVTAPDRTVRVAGHVHYPAEYQYRPGETLAELLAVANGGDGFPAGVADPVRVARIGPAGERHFLEFSLADAVGAAGGAVRLEPFDAVYVAERVDYQRQPSARISGQVRRPGTYPIRPDTTTLGELIEMAGGFTGNASLTHATLRRQAGPWRMALAQADSVPLELLSESERDIMRVRLQSDASMLSVDLHEVFAAGADARALTLQADDEVAVPELRHEVLVLGAVGRPGIVGFDGSRRPTDYLGLAGGATRRADVGNAAVIRSPSGSRIALRDAPALQPGDVIVVPFRRDVNWGQRIQIITSIAATLTGLALTAITLF